MTTQILKRIATTKIPSEDWYVGVIFFYYHYSENKQSSLSCSLLTLAAFSYSAIATL